MGKMRAGQAITVTSSDEENEDVDRKIKAKFLDR